MNKAIGGNVGTGIMQSYTVRFYAGAVCLSNSTIETDTMDNAIAMVLRATVEHYDDGLTSVDAILASDLYNGKPQPTVPRTVHEVKYLDLYTVMINGNVYSTDVTEMMCTTCHLSPVIEGYPTCEGCA